MTYADTGGGLPMSRPTVRLTLALAAVTLAAACSSTTQPAATTSSPAPPATTSTAPLATASTAAAATTSPTVKASDAAKSALLAWGTRGFPAIQSLGTVVQSVDKAAHANDIPALTTACHSLAAAVTRVRALLPTPDRQLTTLIQSGLNELAASATACIAGNYSISGPELDTASNIFVKVRQRETAIAGPG
jgi:hypothetical protein